MFYKRHTGKPTVSYADAVEEALCFGWIDGIKRSIDEQRYMHRFTPRKAASRWSATNRRRAAAMVEAGRMMPAGLAAIDAAKRRGTWEAAPPSVDLSMPPELEAVLDRNGKAAAFFESLTPAARRQFIGWINLAKRPETRQKRVRESVELLARGRKLGMR